MALPRTIIIHVPIIDDQVSNVGRDLAEQLTKVCAQQESAELRRRLTHVIPSPQTGGVLAVFEAL